MVFMSSPNSNATDRWLRDAAGGEHMTDYLREPAAPLP
jgi:hypothetical protein